MQRKHIPIIAALTAFGAITATAQDETAVSAKTEAVALFKNGYAVVWQEIEVPKSGAYRWEDVPAAIHGTFFIESDMEVETRATQRLVTVPVDAKNPPRLAPGQLVDVWVSTPTLNEKLSGKIVDTMPAAEQNSLLSDSTHSSSREYYWYQRGYTVMLNMPVVLEGDNAHHFLTGNNIVAITTREPVRELTARRPVMVFNASKKDGGGGKIRVVYLTKGATWAPSYRVDILDGKRLRIEQATVVRNEGLPMTDAEVSLVSGFPQIECENVLSPIMPSQTLALFFQQLSAPKRGNNSRYMSQSVSYNDWEDGGLSIFDTSALAAGEGPDIYYNSIGRRTLETGDTLSLTTGKGEAEYLRLLECDLTKQAAEFYSQSSGNRDNATPDVFDVLKFQNPLPFPITTAPVTVMNHARFLGQSQTGWVNPGQVASVKITKVMNVSATYAERAVDAEPRVMQEFRFTRHIKRDITGTIDLANRRNERVTLHLNSAFLGVIETSDLAPTKQSVSAKDHWPNDLNELFWEITLEPGEKKTITINGWRWFRN